MSAQYPIDWGPTLVARRKGLPDIARPASTVGAAAAYVRARSLQVGTLWFAQSMLALGWNESSLRFALPAHKFDLVPGPGQKYSAWGVFNFNRGAVNRARLHPGMWPFAVYESVTDRSLLYPPSTGGRPTTIEEEVGLPIDYYAGLIRIVNSTLGGSVPWEILWRIPHLHHKGPVHVRAFIANYRSTDPWYAWRNAVRPLYQRQIDTRFRQAERFIKLGAR